MMKLLERGALVLLILCLAAGAGRADWEPGDPFKMHWPQLPDLTPTGLDVDATGDAPYTPNHLADDFLCTATGPITDIHIWGSFLNDQLPQDPTGLPDPGGMVFRLSIHPDFMDPDGPGPDYSRPLMPPLREWQFLPGDPNYQVRLWAGGLQEQYWNPTEPGIPLTPDSVCWQFNFFIDEAEAFRQKEGEIYWLDVQAWDPTGSGARWGWKTTNPIETPHFNDDAVFWDPFLPPDPTLGQWNELRYPLGHPYEGQSIDLAFVITPEPTTWALIGLGASALAFRRRRQ